jgi:site-specific DNA recombinase
MSPDLKAPLAGYVRVSRVGERDEDRLRSPEFQRAAIARFADAEEYSVEWFEPELDVSGSKTRRPVLDAILDGIREGQLSGLVVAKLDRLSRMSAGDRVRLFEEVEGAGGVILSASEQLDTSTPEGRFARDVFLGVARMQWEKYRDGFDQAKAAAMQRGAALGPTPFGYARADDGRLVEHPEDGPALRAAFTLAARQGLDAAHAHLAAHGGRVWTAATVRRLLSKTSYLGEHRYGALSTPVPQLVSRAVWEAAQPEPAKRRRAKGTFPLSGLAVCGTCGGPLVGARGGADGRRMLRCAAGLKTHRGPRCKAPAAVSAEPLESLVRRRVAEALREHPGYQQRDEDDAEALQRAEETLQEAEADRAAFVTVAASLARSLGAEAVERQAAELAARVDAAQIAFREAAVKAEGRGVEAPAAELLETAELEELGELLRGLLEAVIVAKGRTALGERVRILPKGAPRATLAAAE